ncbi:hypothetical protein ONZ45_g19206 [Pleurotus djamor]|nr:hypothetical protein ONZ45_g19206 [Pleurotus djamor]
MLKFPQLRLEGIFTTISDTDASQVFLPQLSGFNYTLLDTVEHRHPSILRYLSIPSRAKVAIYLSVVPNISIILPYIQDRDIHDIDDVSVTVSSKRVELDIRSLTGQSLLLIELDVSDPISSASTAEIIESISSLPISTSSSLSLSVSNAQLNSPSFSCLLDKLVHLKTLCFRNAKESVFVSLLSVELPELVSLSLARCELVSSHALELLKQWLKQRSDHGCPLSSLILVGTKVSEDDLREMENFTSITYLDRR